MNPATVFVRGTEYLFILCQSQLRGCSCIVQEDGRKAGEGQRHW